jgi:hypothetical protein
VKGLGDVPPALAGGAQLGHGLEIHIPPGSADGRAAAGPARGLPGQSGADPVANEFPLELGEAGAAGHEERTRVSQ